jgi:hypothetical protein
MAGLPLEWKTLPGSSKKEKRVSLRDDIDAANAALFEVHAA